MASEVIAFVPVKPLVAAKSRLAPVLRLPERQALVLLCLHRVLQALQGTSRVSQVLVIGTDASVQQVAREAGAHWLADPGWDLNEALRQGFAHAFARGAQASLFLPADLPLLQALEIEGLLDASHGLSRLVLASAHDGGTNAILLPRGVPFTPRMGPGSFASHQVQAERAGLPVVVYHSPGLTFDVDTPEDLRQFQERLPGWEAEMQKWHGLLDVGARHASPLRPSP